MEFFQYDGGVVFDLSRDKEDPGFGCARMIDSEEDGVGDGLADRFEVERRFDLDDGEAVGIGGNDVDAPSEQSAAKTRFRGRLIRNRSRFLADVDVVLEVREARRVKGKPRFPYRNLGWEKVRIQMVEACHGVTVSRLLRACSRAPLGGGRRRGTSR